MGKEARKFVMEDLAMLWGKKKKHSFKYPKHFIPLANSISLACFPGKKFTVIDRTLKKLLALYVKLVKVTLLFHDFT